MKPLLKWVGGKRQLLPLLRPFYPRTFGTFVEPFVGSGAVFFDLYGAGRLEGARAILIDSNPDLIGTYTMVRDAPDAVADALERLAAGHAAGGAQFYYEVRDQHFNPARAATAHKGTRYTPELAAMLLYLNRTGYNGLFRVNARGGYNVPAGRYIRPRIADRARVHAAAAALGAPGVELRLGSFDLVTELAAGGDFVYLDPPYAPLSATANFTNYTAPGFGAAEQATVQACAVTLASRGCQVLLSNSTAPLIASLYDGNPATAAAGLVAHRVPARRAINRHAAGRGPIEEYVISNIAPHRSSSSDGAAAKRG